MLSLLTYASCLRRPTSSQPKQGCDKGLWYIRSHLNRDLSVEKLSKSVNMSRSQLFRIFKKAYGILPQQMISVVRTEHTQRMLCDNTLSLEKIASECGYANTSHCCVTFKRLCGVTPTEYRKMRTMTVHDISATEKT